MQHSGRPISLLCGLFGAAHQQFVDPVAIHIHHLDADVFPYESFSCTGNVLEMVHHEATQGLVAPADFLR